MEDERVDLSPLDPALDRLRYERRIRRVMDAAAGELARRRAGTGPFALLAEWTRPTLAAAAVIALLAVGALSLADRASAPPQMATSVVEGLADAAPAADWLEEGGEPTELLVLSMERR